MVLSNASKYRPEASAWRKAYYAVPLLPVHDPLNTEAVPIDYANSQDLGYRSSQNPFSLLSFSENKDKIMNVMANFYAEITILKP